MAELVVGDGARLELRAEGVLVGRRSDDGLFKPDVDLASLTGGRTVSRRHVRIFQRDGQWFLKVEPSVTNPTMVAGRELKAGDECPLKNGDEVRLGKVSFVFRALTESPVSNPEATYVGATDAIAEFRSDGRSFALNAPDGRELTFGRHSDDGAYRPDVDLADLPNGRTVSRRHGRLFRRGDEWFMRVEAEVTNPTLLNGRKLAFGEEVPLDDGNILQFGRVIVTFHYLKKYQTVGPELIELIVDPVQVAVDVGGKVEATITIINHTGHVDWFELALDGIPSEWYTV
ncbi:MAG TPA: FHA domain-containing protein, partial [Chloroflexota bacterium]|nr:FHA domain-containing protein [Chloroflexota bacterium]